MIGQERRMLLRHYLEHGTGSSATRRSSSVRAGRQRGAAAATRAVEGQHREIVLRHRGPVTPATLYGAAQAAVLSVAGIDRDRRQPCACSCFPIPTFFST